MLMLQFDSYADSCCISTQLQETTWYGHCGVKHHMSDFNTCAPVVVVVCNRDRHNTVLVTNIASVELHSPPLAILRLELLLECSDSLHTALVHPRAPFGIDANAMRGNHPVDHLDVCAPAVHVAAQYRKIIVL